MSRYSVYARELAEVERRMQRLEQRLERLGGTATRAAASGMATAAQATDRVGDALMSALSDLVDRFRGSARSLNAGRFGQDAARFGYEAQQLGSKALHRVANEVERRPLMTIAIAVGVGLLIGIGGRRR